jgi:hypothetical protein
MRNSVLYRRFNVRRVSRSRWAVFVDGSRIRESVSPTKREAISEARKWIAALGRFERRGVLVSVTHQDVKQGRCGSFDGCPVALAVRRAVGTASVDVRRGRIRVGRQAFRLPRSAYRFIQKFDGGYQVSGFGFRLIREAA